MMLQIATSAYAVRDCQWIDQDTARCDLKFYGDRDKLFGKPQRRIRASIAVVLCLAGILTALWFTWNRNAAQTASAIHLQPFESVVTQGELVVTRSDVPGLEVGDRITQIFNQNLALPDDATPRNRRAIGPYSTLTVSRASGRSVTVFVHNVLGGSLETTKAQLPIKEIDRSPGDLSRTMRTNEISREDQTEARKHYVRQRLDVRLKRVD